MRFTFLRLFVILLVLAQIHPAPAADKIESKSTYAEKYGASKGSPTIDPAKDLPRYPAVEPKDAIATWQIKKGFKLEFAAHEPQVRSPIAISFDERGRMFVCEMIDYSEMRDVTPHLGRISMLEDKDGDGYYETSTVFADDLPWPTGLICANGGIYVIATPDIWFFKDTKGTGRADVREKVFTGFGTGLKLLNVQGLANCPQWGQDNRIHIQAGGGNRGVVTCLKRPELKGVELGGRDFWFDPRTYEFGLEAGGAQYGMSFDTYGRKFACSNSDHLQFFVYDDRYAARNPYFTMPPARQSIAADGGAAEVFRISPDEPWRIVRTRWRVAGVVKGVVEGGGRVSGYFTGATGTTVYRGDAYGDDFFNNTFTGDAGGQLVHRKKIYPDGVSLIGKRPEDEQNFEFAASKDTWVRVVNFANAPDGCLYVIDMYREVIEHPWSIPDEIKKYLDLNSGNDRGRIYRVVPESSALSQSGPLRPLSGTKAAERANAAQGSSAAQRPVRTTWERRPGSAAIPGGKSLADMSTAELVKTLEHPNGWHRDTASRLLYEKQDKSAVPLLEKLVSESSNPLAKIHALGALKGLDALSEGILIQALRDSNPRVKERAVLLAEKYIAKGDLSPSLEQPMIDLAKHTADLRVQMQLAFTLGSVAVDEQVRNGFGGRDKIDHALLSLLEAANGDRMVGSAIMTSPRSSPLSVDVFRLAKDNQNFLRHAEALVVSESASMAKEGKVNVDWILFNTEGDPNRSRYIHAFAEGLKRAGTAIAKVDTEKKLAAVFAKAADTVRDAKAADSERLEAINLIGLDSPKQSVPALLACLGKSQPESLQTAGISALGQFSGKDVTDAVIEHWTNLQKKARGAALTMMLTRPDRATALLHAIEETKIAASDLSASDVQSLFKHKDKAVSSLADKVLAELKPPSRESVIEKLKPALTTKGDATRGQTVFTQRCMACHKANNLGVDVAPPLVTVKTKGREGIFTAILDPNKEVAPQYIAYTINTKDGQTLAGIITNDTANSMTLKMMGGVELNIPRSNIKGSSSTGISLMPEGIEAGMTVQDMADLLDFIESLK